MFKKKTNGYKVYNFYYDEHCGKTYEQLLLEAIHEKDKELSIYDSNDYDILEFGDRIFIKRKDLKNPKLHPVRTAEWFVLNGEKCLRTLDILK